MLLGKATLQGCQCFIVYRSHLGPDHLDCEPIPILKNCTISQFMCKESWFRQWFMHWQWINKACSQ